MTKKAETADYGADILCLYNDNTYIYYGGEGVINDIKQAWKSNMTIREASSPFGLQPTSIT